MFDPGLDLALQDAIRRALLDDPGVTELVGKRVFDRPPDREPLNGFPYLTIGDDEIADDSNSCSEASNCLSSIHIWSRAYGTVEAKRIGGLVRRALDRPIPIAGHLTSVGHHEISTYRPGRDPTETEGVIVFRFLVDPLV